MIPLLDMLLTDSEINQLHDVIAPKLSDNGYNAALEKACGFVAFNTAFSNYCKRIEHPGIHVTVLRNFLASRNDQIELAKIEASNGLALYSFVTEELYGNTLKATDPYSSLIQRKIENLKVNRSKRLRDAGTLSDLIKETTGDFSEHKSSGSINGAYFGYRHSSTTRRTIRFSLKIWQDEFTGAIRFKNVYRTENKIWETNGHGFVQGQVTYLFGSAANPDEFSEQRGLRLFALSRIEGTKFLTGVVISHDGIGPIAARIFALRCKEHDFKPESYANFLSNTHDIEEPLKNIYWMLSQQYSLILNNKSHDKVPQNVNPPEILSSPEIDEFLNKILEVDQEIASRNEIDTTIAFDVQVNAALSNSVMSKRTLEEMISNLSISTIRGYDLRVVSKENKQKINKQELDFELLKQIYYDDAIKKGMLDPNRELLGAIQSLLSRTKVEY